MLYADVGPLTKVISSHQAIHDQLLKLDDDRVEYAEIAHQPTTTRIMQQDDVGIQTG